MTRSAAVALIVWLSFPTGARAQFQVAAPVGGAAAVGGVAGASIAGWTAPLRDSLALGGAPALSGPQLAAKTVQSLALLQPKLFSKPALAAWLQGADPMTKPAVALQALAYETAMEARGLATDPSSHLSDYLDMDLAFLAESLHTALPQGHLDFVRKARERLRELRQERVRAALDKTTRALGRMAEDHGLEFYSSVGTKHDFRLRRHVVREHAADEKAAAVPAPLPSARREAAELGFGALAGLGFAAGGPVVLLSLGAAVFTFSLILMLDGQPRSVSFARRVAKVAAYGALVASVAGLLGAGAPLLGFSVDASWRLTALPAVAALALTHGRSPGLSPGKALFVAAFSVLAAMTLIANGVVGALVVFSMSALLGLFALLEVFESPDWVAEVGKSLMLASIGAALLQWALLPIAASFGDVSHWWPLLSAAGGIPAALLWRTARRADRPIGRGA
ncbi:MAG: hypothetical protein HY553_21825 [Elusimicrobia bacterium]|nr:hypothetical protein [Elusimicrobiota bacterium]